MDPLDTGGEGRHLTWRDLPATPPIGPTWIAEPAAPDLGSAPVGLAPSPRPRRRTTFFALGGGAVAGVLALIALLVVANPLTASGPDPVAGRGGAGAASPTAPSNGGTGAAPTQPPSGTSGSEPLADTAARILPSVVQIETSAGLGAGFVADTNGDILTAGHVVSGSSQVTVKLQDGSTTSGTVVASDATIDTAVVKVERTDLPALTLGDSSQVRVGQQAIAVGSPFGLDETVTSGIVSALDRSLQTQTSQLSGLIQTDAPINPGNSGGPLTDRNGAVIGINDAIASTSGQSSGVGFAIPINDAKALLVKVQNGSLGSQQQPQAGGSGGSGGSGGTGQGGSDPFGGSNPFGNIDPNQGGSDPFNSPLFQWFLQHVLPQLNQGQSGAGQ
ncbi:MAG: S1C family serine protease [Candidatus Limnocylindrales bacterium]